MHQVARRWVAAGAHVTWIAARAAGLPRTSAWTGSTSSVSGGPLTLYVRAALLMLARRRRVDYVVDCQNGIPYFSPLFLSRALTIVQLVHHIHQDQFATRFGPLLTAVGPVHGGTGGTARLRHRVRWSPCRRPPATGCAAVWGSGARSTSSPNGAEPAPAMTRPPRPRPDDHRGEQARSAQADRAAAPAARWRPGHGAEPAGQRGRRRTGAPRSGAAGRAAGSARDRHFPWLPACRRPRRPARAGRG